MITSTVTKFISKITIVPKNGLNNGKKENLNLTRLGLFN